MMGAVALYGLGELLAVFEVGQSGHVECRVEQTVHGQRIWGMPRIASHAELTQFASASLAGRVVPTDGLSSPDDLRCKMKEVK
jgi:hypothetical protein